MQPHAVLLLRPRTLLKTSSGKVQRHACAQGFREGTLETLAVSVAQEAPAPAPAGGRRGARGGRYGRGCCASRCARCPPRGGVGLLVEVVREGSSPGSRGWISGASPRPRS